MSRLPAIFVSHGAPTLAIEPGPTHTFLQELGPQLERPRAILCISAHWEASAPTLSQSASPTTIYDFWGFPAELYRMRYPAPGDPALAQEAADCLQQAGLAPQLDPQRGLDHGAWVPLTLMFPAADIPVVQLSVQSRLGAQHQLALGQALRPLRDAGVLILGSGGATHNLREFGRYAEDDPVPAYVQAFDQWLFQSVTGGDVDALVAYETRAPSARRNHPTPEHFLPLLVPLGAASEGARGRVLHRTIAYGILSMAAYAWD